MFAEFKLFDGSADVVQSEFTGFHNYSSKVDKIILLNCTIFWGVYRQITSVFYLL